MLRGLTTVNLYADDLAAAQSWYTELLGTEPYFVREVDGKPAYIVWIGDYQHELGVMDGRFAAPGPVPNTMTYWHVDDVTAAYQCLLDLGAGAHEGPREHAPGFITASVIDPFGNVLGVMFNQHYLDILAQRT